VKIGIIDYGGGNLRSVANALRSLGHAPQIVASPDQVADSTHLILPGQGAFGDCMERLEKRGLADFLKAWIQADRPYFGICVGYQILFESSEEAPTAAGLGILRGGVHRFHPEPGLKIPHMGWNSALARHSHSPVWHDLGAEPYFYYVHSYFPVPSDRDVVLAATTYGSQSFAAAVERGKMFACQFHPEKSQETGLRLIRNFIAPDRGCCE
jgi:imidazole glycerol phosphate synthase glutamine amidotransferase subunit